MSKNTLVWLAFAILVICLAACGGGGADHEHHAEAAGDHEAAPAEAPAAAGASASATIEPSSDSWVTGSATFTEGPDGVTMTLTISGATPGEHAFHLHEVGDCSAPDGTSAGGHWNPTAMDHGKWGTDPFHLGDVGNLVVGEDGTATLAFSTPLWSIGTGDDNDVVGRAVIVHAGVDDFTSQPTGAAGGRIGCGVIQQDQ